MTEPAATTALPDEDRYAFPQSWRRRARPRRGDGVDRKVRLEPKEARSFIKAQLPRLREMLALPENEAYAWAGNDFLDGNPNPVGAAAVAALIGITHRTSHVPAASMINLLVMVHGLPLAACAAVETMGVQLTYGGNRSERRIVYPLNDFAIGYEWTKVVPDIVKDLRTLVAGAPETEYAETMAALELHRDTLPKALTTSLIAPDLTHWVDQLCDLLAPHEPNHYISNLLLQTITTPRQLETAGEAALSGTLYDDTDAADLLARLGPEAFPIFKRHIESWPERAGRKAMYRAVAAIPTDKAMAVLLDHLDTPAAVSPAMEAAARFPVRALRLIAPRIAGADRERRNLLATVLRSDPILHETALPAMDREVREAIEPFLWTSRRVRAAAPEDLPKLLVEPSLVATKPKTGTVEGLVPLPIERLVWADGERERFLPTYHFQYRTPKQWRQEAGNFDGLDWQLFFLANAPEDLAVPLARQWDGKEPHPSKEHMSRVLARFELDVADQIAALAGIDAELRSVLLPLANLQAARIAADSLTRRKSFKPDAIAWLARHAADAAALLIPDALGKDRKLRRNAQTALDLIRATHGSELLLAAAAKYGEEAVAAIKPLAELDPLAPPSDRTPTAAGWAVPAALPELLLRGRELSLPDAAVQRVIEVMSVTGLGWRYAGIDMLTEACDPESLARFSWAVFERWTASGAPLADSWAFTQLAHFGDDDTVRELVPLISDWPSRNLHKRAAAGIEVLGGIGTMTALRAIHRIAEKVGHWSLEQTASAQIDAIAAAQGLSREQLADRLVPDFGIGEEAALVYDYGPRQFKVGFDEQLRPLITDMDGKPRKALPPPGSRDDAELATSARRRFTQLKKDVRTVASDLIKRIEWDMVHQQPRTKADFDRYFVQHALVRQFAYRLIWSSDVEGGLTVFRLAEDGTCTGIDERELKLPDDATIRPAHPITLGDTATTWSEILADYKIIQPFKQLDRPVFAFTDEELRTGRLARFAGVKVSTGRILGLYRRDWVLEDSGITTEIPHVGHVLIRLDPAEYDPDAHPVQTVLDAWVNESGDFADPAAPIVLAGADPILVSEALAELARIAENA